MVGVEYDSGDTISTRMLAFGRRYTGSSLWKRRTPGTALLVSTATATATAADTALFDLLSFESVTAPAPPAPADDDDDSGDDFKSMPAFFASAVDTNTGGVNPVAFSSLNSLNEKSVAMNGFGFGKNSSTGLDLASVHRVASWAPKGCVEYSVLYHCSDLRASFGMVCLSSCAMM